MIKNLVFVGIVLSDDKFAIKLRDNAVVLFDGKI